VKKKGITKKLKGHHGHVTSLHFHPKFSDYDFAPIFISSSVDWTACLWNHKRGGKKPILKFEGFGDYVYEAQWSPIHPALFASADGNGCITLWNLNQEQEVPILQTQVTELSINKLKWNKEGAKILIGDSGGHVKVLDVGEFGKPGLNDFKNFEKTIENIIRDSTIDTSEKKDKIDEIKFDHAEDFEF